MLADVGTGITATDEAIAGELRGCEQPLLLVVNKCEKDVDRLVQAGLLATTNPGGAGNWSDEYKETLQKAQSMLSALDIANAWVGDGQA